MSLYENCDGASFQKIRSMAFIGIRLIISQAYEMHQRKKSGRSMKIYRMQWYSSILGGCSSDARSLVKTKPSIKLRFQAAALRVLFVWPSKTQHASVNPLSPLESPLFTTSPLSVLETRKATLVTALFVVSIPVSNPFSQVFRLLAPFHRYLRCLPCGNQCPWPSHGSIDGTGQGRTCGSDQPCACRRG